MGIHCCRCSGAAGAVLGFDYEAREVWLGDLVGELEIGADYALCDSHADRMTAPVGWLLTDNRSLMRPMFVIPDVA